MHTNMRMTSAPASSNADTCDIPCFNGEIVRVLKATIPSERVVADGVRVFGALSDATRLKLVIALARGQELCVCDLAHVVGASISTASHHLRKLRDLGLVQHRNDGRMAYYSIHDPRMIRGVIGSVLTDPGDAG